MVFLNAYFKFFLALKIVLEGFFYIYLDDKFLKKAKRMILNYVRGFKLKKNHFIFRNVLM